MANTQSPLKLEIQGYAFVEGLGRGNFGETWKVRMKQNKGDGQLLAAKRLHEFMFPYEEDMGRRFRRSFVTNLFNLEHPNVVRFHGLIGMIVETPPAIVMELLDNDLRRFLEKSTSNSKLRFTEVVDIMSDVARGLNYLHTRNPAILHLSLTSRNVLLTPCNKHAKVSDYGLAEEFSCKEGVLAFPTPSARPYTTPEVFQSPHSSKLQRHAKVDTFSYGVLLLEAIVGHSPQPDPFRSPFTAGKCSLLG